MAGGVKEATQVFCVLLQPNQVIIVKTTGIHGYGMHFAIFYGTQPYSAKRGVKATAKSQYYFLLHSDEILGSRFLRSRCCLKRVKRSYKPDENAKSLTWRPGFIFRASSGLYSIAVHKQFLRSLLISMLWFTQLSQPFPEGIVAGKL